MVWYSHLFQNFPQFVVIHTVKGFGVVNKAEIDVSLELSCFFDDPGMLAVCCLDEASCTGCLGGWVLGGWVMPGLVFKWFPLCEFSLFDTT